MQFSKIIISLAFFMATMVSADPALMATMVSADPAPEWNLTMENINRPKNFKLKKCYAPCSHPWLCAGGIPIYHLPDSTQGPPANCKPCHMGNRDQDCADDTEFESICYEGCCYKDVACTE